MTFGGLPHFYRAFCDLKNGRLLGASPFLAGAALLAAATRQVTSALEMIWIQEVGRFVEDTLQDRSRRAVRGLSLGPPGGRLSWKTG